MNLILIRHTSVDVERGVCYGQTDVALSSSFHTEAAQVADKLRSRTFDRIYSSPLSRCLRLADYCGYPEAITDPRLMEMNFGAWEMKKFDEITDPRLQDWFDDYMNVAPTAGESAMQQRRRFIDFTESLRHSLPSSASVAAFTHGGILVHALNAFSGKNYDELFRAIPPYGSVIEVNI
ncbi:MAG: alpha-ribazole phosphatase [Paramuribaculum sp.]|nr:alpha-ribazole phosphatase [Paramuribaculum sp.]